MKSKRLLTLVLALCLMISLLTPAAAAVTVAPEDAVQSGSNFTGIKPVDDLIDSVAGSLGIPTLKNDAMKPVYEDGQWIIRDADGVSTVLTHAQLPEHIKALRDARKYFVSEDTVAAFVVLHDAPTVEQYSSISDVPQKATDALMARQDDLIDAIEEEVLQGEELQVVTQFTYLTNAVVVETEFANLEAIAALDGVKSVFLSPIYYPCETNGTMLPYTVSSGEMTNVADVWQNLGYTGAGMTIAVMDTGLDIDHPSFEAAPADPAWNVDWLQEKLDTLDLNAENLYNGTLTAEDLYYNAKIPYTFNYSNGTTSVIHNDGLGDHGTHVAGIAAANKVEGAPVVGMAPDAQIIAMKVFNSRTGGSSMYDLIAALEDAMTLEVDVVNMSLGSPAGFCDANVEEIDSIFRRISETDIIVDVAMGNEGTSMNGSLYGNYMFTTDHIDNATVSSPATYANAMAIASVDNTYIYGARFQLADESNVFYMHSVEYLYGLVEFSLELLSDQTLEYVMVPGLGAEEDFYDANGNSIVEGKVAVVNRGELNFGTKAANAQAAGAVAVLIWNNQTEDIFSFGMTTEIEEGNYPKIPVVLITLEDGQRMADAQDKTMYISPTAAARPNPDGGQMSYFSCWGVAPNMGLLPDLTGVGGNILSCYDAGHYGIMSGTSMATPQVAGVTALVLQFLKEAYPDATEDQVRILADSLLMSTANPVIDQITGLEASPRQQGAGLVNTLAAITAGAYLTVEGSARPKAELGESDKGVYSFVFTIHNDSDAAKVYQLSASLLCEDYAEDEDFPGLYFMASTEHALDNSAVSFSKNTVTVAAGSTASVAVTIDLTKADKEWINTYFPNGNYVEGYVYLKGEGEATLSLPFLGFYGDWSDAPVFDTGYWFEEGFWDDGTEESPVIAEGVEANQFFHVPFISLGATDSDWVLGFSAYRDSPVDSDGNLAYDEKNNVISPNGDGVLDSITDWYLSLMRNAEWVYLTYTDEEGNVLHQEALDYISKTMYNSNYGSVVPFVYSWYYDGLYDFTDANGEPLPHGTKLTLTISARLADGDDKVDDWMEEIPITIDTEAPVLVGEVKESTDENGNYLTLTFREEHPAYVAVMNESGTQIYNTYTEEYLTDNGDGTWTITVDVTNLGEDVTVALCDYGCNERFYNLQYTLTDNIPEMDTSSLYAYQIYDEGIYYYYGWDYMFGWSVIDKQNAEVTMISSDMYEYYALNAAEYAGGYVFGVDAGGNLIYMTPGIWNRHMICNLNLNVLDMAFDETTGTMYLTSKLNKTEDDVLYRLYTVDLLTGRLKMLKEYDSETSMPWAMTFVDGELYAAKKFDGFNSGFYKVDIAGGTYNLERVLDANGENFIPLSASGSSVMPNYAQSMTYSEADGLIYWAYFDGSYCELLTIDPKNWTSTAAPMERSQEYVGLLMLEDDGYTFPESSAVTKLVMSEKRLVLSEGQSSKLTVTQLPWNAPASQVTWTSSDESVAVVDQEGNVTGLREGDAVITATVGNLSVTSKVTVVFVSGNLHLYNYYSGDGNWGNWLNIDLETMDGSIVVQSPFDFMSADYNGHDGLIYGYAEDKWLYSLNPETGKYTALGQAHALPYDMAYDYSSGLLYAIVPDYYTWTTKLYYVNTLNGALVEVSTVNDVYLTLACDGDGILYAINAYGKVYELSFYAGSNMLQTTHKLDTPVGMLQLIQSMCYDHQNDVLLWASAENGTIYWLDVKAEDPYFVDLGDPTESGSIEFTGLYVIPDEIPELDYTPVQRVEGDDILVLTGASKAPSITVYPLNATHKELTFVSHDESIVRVEKGTLVGVKTGKATVTATVNDEGKSYSCTFTVSVKSSTDNIRANLIQDMYNYNGYCWIDIPDNNPGGYTAGDYAFYGGVYMTIYSAEQYNGKIYVYGYDDTDWNANFQFMVIDAETGSLLSMTDMGDEFPFVYDMSFDYTTGTMYAVAGTSEASDLYMVNLETGELIAAMETEPMFLSLAIASDGTMYAMARSEEIFEMDSWFPEYEDCILYVLDPEKGTCEEFMNMGMVSNALASMAYDHDTGYLYWTRLGNLNGIYESGLYLIDPADKTCFNLGSIGTAGSQVTGLMIAADNYPQTPDVLQNISITTGVLEINEGTSGMLDTFLQPVGLDVELIWTSEDESIATVDEYGVVTGVAHGITTVTVTVHDGGKTFTANCKVVVYGVEDYFLSYNLTNGGFSTIGRPNPVGVNDLTQGEELPPVRSMAMAEGVLYGYDYEGNLFVADPDNGYQRTYIGHHGVEVKEDWVETSIKGTYTYVYDHNYGFWVRDMAWDPVNERMLAVGCYYDHQYVVGSAPNGFYTEYEEELELVGGCRVYEVDLTTGALVELATIGNWYDAISGVTAITVTDTGAVYIYTTVMDYICRLNPETGYASQISTLQNIGGSGSSEGEPMAMEYDPLTGNIYMLITQNGSKYEMYKYNVATTAMSRVGIVGVDAEHFAGLVFNTHAHVLEFVEEVVPTCDLDGYTVYHCTECGRTVEEVHEGTALGHDFEGGHCTVCGASGIALGDVNANGSVDIADAILVAAYFNERLDLTADQLAAADVNGDGNVNISDAILIAAYFNERIDKFPAEN